MSPPTTADAVIIGGGAVGTSLLYHLTRLGMTDVVLLEKGKLSSGSSGDSAAIVRQHYSNEVSIRLVRKSLEIFQSFGDELGASEVFTPAGWLFLCPPEAADLFDENLAQLKRLGVRTWEIGVNEAAEMLPGLNTDGIGKVAYEPDSGYADPSADGRGVRGPGRRRRCGGARQHAGHGDQDRRWQSDSGYDAERRDKHAGRRQCGRSMGQAGG